MNSREKILGVVKKNQPPQRELPEIHVVSNPSVNVVEQFSNILVSIGGSVIEVKTWQEISDHINKTFPDTKRKITTIPELKTSIGSFEDQPDPHIFEDIKIAVLPGQFGVAENGAIWITDAQMGDRALPFISENLALVIRTTNILPTMRQAYDRIDLTDYNFGTFIAGPSKTADIEQSLVLGAHGPKSLVVFLMSGEG